MQTLAEVVEGWHSSDPTEEAIYCVLRAEARGPECAVPAREIAVAAGIEDNPQQTETRRVIRRMIGRGAPIVATSRGYHIPTDRGQLQRYERGLGSRQREIGERRRDVVRLLQETTDQSDQRRN